MEVYDRYLAEAGEGFHSDMFFPILYAYDDYFTVWYRELEGYLVLYVQDSIFHEKYCMAPIGHYERESFSRLLESLETLFLQAGLPFMFSDIPDWLLPMFEEQKQYHLISWYLEARSDYIYRKEDFIHKQTSANDGHKYRKFIRNEKPSYEVITEENAHACLEVTEKYWCRLHSCDYCVDGCEKKALKRLLDAWTEMGAGGIIIYDKDKEPIAFSIAGRERDELFMMMSKKKKLYGIGEYIHITLLELYGEGIRTINNGIDLGLEGQKTFKTRCADKYTLSHNYNLVLERRK